MDPKSTPARFEDQGAIEAFNDSRRRMFGIAYRILGSASDAEDVVQEAWMRWQLCDRSVVREPAAFLSTTVSRLALNALARARAHRETYIGPWLPEPVDTSEDPTLGAERAEALDLAALMLMERLSPAERAAYVLREAFDYTYDRIAEILETTSPAARKLVSRARQHLADGKRRAADESSHRAFFRSFLAAARTGDISSLEALLAAEAVSYTDGGGVVRRTARRPIRGRDTLTRFLFGVAQWFWDDVSLTIVEANGRAAALLLRQDTPFALLTITVREQQVEQIMWVMNPAKLRAILAGFRGGDRYAVQAPTARWPEGSLVS
jgi:RNA polymerase sigma-70 factor (ECF subfamily)